MRPRIALIAAIDNYGQVYISLVQSNTTSSMMKLFLWELTKTLDAEDANWREHTLLMHDGAPYFGSRETMQVCRELDLPIFLLAPYSYLMQPIEMFFGIIKSKNINPTGQLTSKK